MHLPATAPSQGLVVIGAHYDTVARSPGADDNGSGTAMAALAAVHLAALPARNYDVEVVFFDLEELGLYGSEAYATSLSGPPVLMINLDMLGYDPGRTAIVPCYDELPEHQARLDALAALHGYRLDHRQTQLGPSDHFSFLVRGWPVLWLTEPVLSPRWHRPSDTPETLDFDYLTHLTTWLFVVLDDLMLGW